MHNYKICIIGSSNIDMHIKLGNEGLKREESIFGNISLIPGGVGRSVIPVNERIELIERLHRIIKEEGKIIIGDFLASDLSIYQDRYKQYSGLEKNTFKTEDGAIIHHFIEEEIYDILKPYYNLSVFETKESKSIHQRPLKSFMVVGTKRRKNEY